MNLFTITFDDENNNEDSPQETVQVSKPVRPSPPRRVNSPNPGQRPGFKRPMPRRPMISRKVQEVKEAENSPKINVSLSSSTIVHPPVVVKLGAKTFAEATESYEYDGYYEEEDEEEEAAPKQRQQHLKPAPPPAKNNQDPNRRKSFHGNDNGINNSRSSPSIHKSFKNLIEKENTSNKDDQPEKKNSSVVEIRKPLKKPSDKMVTYRLVRTKNVSIRGKRIHFQLYQGGVPLLHSKIKGIKKRDVIYIAEGTDLHFGQSNYVGAILYTSNATTFSLRKQNEYGDEILTIKFIPGESGKPRNVSIYFTETFQGIPDKLSSRKPTLNANNEWALDMRGKFTMKSIKNCVLVDNDDNEYAFIMKVEKKTLGIEVCNEFSNLIAMTLGITSFLCKL